MTIQNSVTVRNARLDALEAAIGTSPKLQLRSGPQPANCAAAATGTLLAQISLPSDWMGAAASGSKAMAGVWADLGLVAGTVAHYRIVDTAGTTCHEQGSVSETGGGGDMIVDNADIEVGAAVTVSAYTRTAGNA